MQRSDHLIFSQANESIKRRLVYHFFKFMQQQFSGIGRKKDSDWEKKNPRTIIIFSARPNNSKHNKTFGMECYNIYGERLSNLVKIMHTISLHEFLKLLSVIFKNTIPLARYSLYGIKSTRPLTHSYHIHEILISFYA